MDKILLFLFLALALLYLYDSYVNKNKPPDLFEYADQEELDKAYRSPLTDEALERAINYGMEEYCKEGGYNYDKEGQRCIYSGKKQCEKDSVWPMNSPDSYQVWGYDEFQRPRCNVGPHAKRTYCEDKLLDWNEETQECEMNEQYCKSYGLDWDPEKKDCTRGGIQIVSEVLLGTSITRSLKNVMMGENACGPGFEARKAAEKI